MDTCGDFPSDGEDDLFQSLPNIELPKVSPVSAEIEIDQSFVVPFPRCYAVQFNQLYNSRLKIQSGVIADRLSSSGVHLPLINVVELVSPKHVAFKMEVEPVKVPQPNYMWTVPNKPKNPRTVDGTLHVLRKAHPGSVVIIGTIINNETSPIIPELQQRQTTSNKSPVHGIYLEDLSGKIKVLIAEGIQNEVNSLINGIVCGMVGNIGMDGKFLAHGIIWPAARPSLMPAPQFNFELVLISGVNHSKDDHSNIRLERLLKFLSLYAHQTKKPCKLVVFFVGNSMDLHGLDTSGQLSVVNELDKMFANLSEIADVYVVPGLSDKTNLMLPQQPLHRMILQCASKSKSFHAITNPARVNLPSTSTRANCEMMIIGEDIIRDIEMATKVNDRMQIAEMILKWGHVCPTAPNTTKVMPGLPQDIFVIKKAPRLLVIGSESFETKACNNTTVIILPKYSLTSSFVHITGYTPQCVKI